MLVVSTIMAAFAVYRMGHDIPEPELEGPFNLYNIVRAHVDNRDYPEWLKNGIWCKYCASFWFGAVFAVLFPITDMISWWMLPVWMVGLSGPAVLYFDYMDTLFPDPDDGSNIVSGFKASDNVTEVND